MTDAKSLIQALLITEEFVQWALLITFKPE